MQFRLASVAGGFFSRSEEIRGYIVALIASLVPATRGEKKLDPISISHLGIAKASDPRYGTRPSLNRKNWAIPINYGS